jgi:nitrogen fixation/metabolism regulation signal transduction histidine kinase
MEKTVPWWVTQVSLALVAAFFIVFGIDLLLTAYRISDPFSFILTFFASNLIILISATLLLAFIVRMVAQMRKTREK